MKTKIIYISGDEVFDIADIRDAFAQVRDALALPADTVLFGVTVDNADAVPVAEPEPEPAPAPKRAPRAKKEKAVMPEPVPEPEPEPEPEVPAPDAPTIPILSVLSSKVIAEPIPVATAEKTLEELLENMTPLDSDAEPEPATAKAATPTDDDALDLDEDETLSKLAVEFAQTQNSITDAPKTGKIGKLKNILPFKKSRGDAGGLVGDLFGWAGIAANDDEFDMPGFFAKA